MFVPWVPHLRPVFLNRSTVEVMMTRRSSAVIDDESRLYQNHTVPLDQGYLSPIPVN